MWCHAQNLQTTHGGGPTRHRGPLGRSPATISPELRRNSVPTKDWKQGYVPLRAQALTDRRRQRDRRLHPAAVELTQSEFRFPLVEGATGFGEHLSMILVTKGMQRALRIGRCNPCPADSSGCYLLVVLAHFLIVSVAKKWKLIG
jgi:hypothetical protein